MPRLKNLRIAAVDVMRGKLIAPADTSIQMSIQVYASSSKGDLDNFVTGICDGLMAAQPGTPVDPVDWLDVPEAARPRHSICFTNDARVERKNKCNIPNFRSKVGQLAAVLSKAAINWLSKFV